MSCMTTYCGNVMQTERHHAFSKTPSNHFWTKQVFCCTCTKQLYFVMLSLQGVNFIFPCEQKQVKRKELLTHSHTKQYHDDYVHNEVDYVHHEDDYIKQCQTTQLSIT